MLTYLFKGFLLLRLIIFYYQHTIPAIYKEQQQRFFENLKGGTPAKTGADYVRYNTWEI